MPHIVVFVPFGGLGLLFLLVSATRFREQRRDPSNGQRVNAAIVVPPGVRRRSLAFARPAMMGAWLRSETQRTHLREFGSRRCEMLCIHPSWSVTP